MANNVSQLGSNKNLTLKMLKTDPSGFPGNFLQVSVKESTQSLRVESNYLKLRTLCKSDGCEASVIRKTGVPKLQK